MNLFEAFKKHNCDKGKDHQYYREYSKTFTPNFKGNILEVGIWHGTSTCAFSEYMPKANLYGIDKFGRVSMEETKCYNLNRVHLAKADSTSLRDIGLTMVKWTVENGSEVEFDVIIDDGKHTPDANRMTFENLWRAVKPGGIYYIEDVWPLDIMTDQEWQHKWIDSHKEIFTMEKYNEFLKALEPYKYERIDLRKESGKPNSYIFKVYKE